MKTLNDVAKAVFDMETMNRSDEIQYVSVEFELKDGISFECYGITIRDIFDCKILIAGVWGSGVVHTINWDEYRGCDDKSVESLVEFLSKCLNKDGFPVDIKINEIETFDY